MKQAVAIGVGGRRDAVALDEAPEQEEVPMGVFLGPKDPGQDLARRIVDGRMEHEARPAVLEPGMVTAVHLDEQARLGHALAAAAMAGRAAVTRAADPRGPEPALHGRTRDMDLVTVADELGEVTIVAAGIRRAGQGQEPLAHRVRQTAWGGPTAVAMRQGGQAVLADLGHQTTEMSSGEAQERGRVRHGQTPLEELDQYVGSLLLSLAQGDSPLVHSPRVTESLSS